jgi:hypothetical protein
MFGALGKAIGRGLIKGVKGGIGKVVKGVKRSFPKTIKGLKNQIKNIRNIFSKPQVFKEEIKQVGTKLKKPIKTTVGKFDESLLKGMKSIKDIPKQKFVKNTLSKAQRLANSKSALKTGKAIKNLF